jgi:hypothetical protein
MKTKVQQFLKYTITTLIFSLLANTVDGQVQSFIRSYGIDGFNYGKRLAVLPDSTYMLMGNKSGMFSQNNVYLIHVNQNGQIINDAVFGDQDLYFAEDMFSQGDSVFIITGHTLNSLSEEYDVFVMWIDKDLQHIRTVTHQASGWDHGKAVVCDASGNVYVVCETYSFSQKAAIWLLTFSPNGLLTNELLLNNSDAEEIAKAMTIVNDTLLYICGSIEVENELSEGFILKYNIQSNFMDTILASHPDRHLSFNDISFASPSRISVAGHYIEETETIKRFVYQSYDLELTLIGEIWDNVPNLFANALCTSHFGETAIACHTNTIGSGNSEFLFFRFNFNAYLSGSTIGGIMYDEPFDIAYALDSTLVLIGTTQSFGTPVFSIMFAKTCIDYKYCFTDQQHITNLESKPENLNNTLQIFPNPAEEYIIVQFSEILFGQLKSIEIYTITGKLSGFSIIEQSNNNLKVNIADLHQGIYMLHIKGEKLSATSRFLKL